MGVLEREHTSYLRQSLLFVGIDWDPYLETAIQYWCYPAGGVFTARAAVRCFYSTRRKITLTLSAFITMFHKMFCTNHQGQISLVCFGHFIAKFNIKTSFSEFWFKCCRHLSTYDKKTFFKPVTTQNQWLKKKKQPMMAMFFGDTQMSL